MKILNAYSGIGGNSKHWSREDHEITAVELDEKVAEVYRDFFPADEVVIDDAHQFIRENYRNFDFIWASPPCPTHSRIRRMGADTGQYDPVYPDMKLYQEIIFLKHFFKGKFAVENVQSYYDPLIRPQKRHRHYIWSNFSIPEINIEDEATHREKGNLNELYGFDLSEYDIPSKKKGKMLRNCVHPELGQEILASAQKKQQKLTEVKSIE